MLYFLYLFFSLLLRPSSLARMCKNTEMRKLGSLGRQIYEKVASFATVNSKVMNVGSLMAHKIEVESLNI